MAEALDGIRKWAATVAAGLALSLIVGGLGLHSDVQRAAVRLEALTVLAQTTESGKQTLDRAVSGINENLQGMRRDIDRVGEAVEKQAEEAANDRALILQELGRLQGASQPGPSRR